MNTAPAPMGDDDIRAFSRPLAVPAPRQRRRWPWVLLGLSALGLVLALAAGALLWREMHGAHGLAGVADWRFGWHEDGWHGEIGPAGAIGVVLALLATLLIVTVVVPLLLLGAGLALGITLALAALAVVVALALGLGALVLVMLLLTSPLWLAGLLLWRALRPASVASSAAA